MSESTYDRRTFIWVGILLLMWLLSALILGCGHMRYEAAPNNSSTTSPNPGRF